MERTSSWHPLDTETAFDHAVERSMREPVVLFKHSAWCGSSFRGRREVEQLTEATDPPVYLLVVQEARTLSRHLAERLDIRHETPQVIVLHQSRPVYHASHHHVKAKTIREAVANLTPL